MAALFEVPNLDDLSTEPADLKTIAGIFRLLSEYSLCKAQAMEARQAGSVAEALQLENRCESIYRLLPEEYRW